MIASEKNKKQGGGRMSEEQQKASAKDSPHYVLGIAVILAALLVSATVYIAAGNLGAALGKINTAAAPSGAGAQQAAPSAAPQAAPAPAPAPSAAPSGKISLSDAASKGSSSAKIMLVEYSDFQCPFCRRFYSDALGQIQKDFIDTGKIKFVYKHFPLGFHPAAQPAAEAFECARDQGKEWEMHDRIFDEQGKLGSGTVQFSAQDIKGWAAQITGLDSEKFNSCLDSGQKASIVSQQTSEGAQAGISGTPGFLITDANGNILNLISGAQPYSVFKQALESAGA